MLHRRVHSNPFAIKRKEQNSRNNKNDYPSVSLSADSSSPLSVCPSDSHLSPLGIVLPLTRGAEGATRRGGNNPLRTV